MWLHTIQQLVAMYPAWFLRMFPRNIDEPSSATPFWLLLDEIHPRHASPHIRTLGRSSTGFHAWSTVWVDSCCNRRGRSPELRAPETSAALSADCSSGQNSALIRDNAKGLLRCKDPIINEGIEIMPRSGFMPARRPAWRRACMWLIHRCTEFEARLELLAVVAWQYNESDT